LASKPSQDLPRQASMKLIHAAALLGSAAASQISGGSIGAASTGHDLSLNPIRKVVNMLQKMVQKVEEEAKKDEELYDKFMCYCKTSGGDLAQSIAESTAKVPQVQHDIEEGEAELQRLKGDVKANQEDRASAQSAVQAADGQRENEHKAFVSASTDYKTYLQALGSAIPAIMKGMSGGALLQSRALSGGQMLRKAVDETHAITDYDRQLVTAFLAGRAADHQGYIPKSNEIVGILKSIEEDFQKNLDEVTKAEEDAVALFKELVAAKNKQLQSLQSAIEKKIQRTGELQVELANMKNEITETEAALIADQQLQAEMETSCSSKEGEWQERLKTRSEELIALHETIKVLNDDDSLDLFKKALPSASLLQVKASKAELRERAVAKLSKLPRNRPATDLLMLALSGKQVDFSKVVKMVDDMITLLKQEQVDDDAKREYCEKSIDSAEDKVKDLGKKAEDLAMSVEEQTEAMKTLEEELKELANGVKALDKSVVEEAELRQAEHQEYSSLMQDNSAAKEILEFAKNRLNKFYNPDQYKPAPAAEEASASFVQISRHREPQPPAPETWSGGYQKKGQETTGVIGMIDTLVKVLEKEMTEAKTEEKNSQKAYEELTQDAAGKRAADVRAMAGKSKAKADYEEGKVAAETEHQVTTKELMATQRYKMDLHQECDWLQQNFDLRMTARVEETESLQQAKAILAGADFSLLQAAAPVAVARGAPVAHHLRGA